MCLVLWPGRKREEGCRRTPVEFVEEEEEEQEVVRMRLMRRRT